MAIGSREDARWGRARVLSVAKRVFSAFLTALPLAVRGFKLQHALHRLALCRDGGDELVELSKRVVAQQPPLRRRAPAASVVELPGPIVADATACCEPSP